MSLPVWTPDTLRRCGAAAWSGSGKIPSWQWPLQIRVITGFLGTMMDDRSRRTATGGRAQDDADAPAPLAEAKIALPGVRRGTIDRRRVRRLLDAGRYASLTLVAAPAGYGKTTAVRSWCATVDAGLAWVTLDARDNDPARLWRYLATAVDRVRPGLGRGALQRLRPAGGSVEDAVDGLMNGIATFDGQLILVLDDLQAVTDADCLSSVDHALASLPGNARVIVVTRADPPLRLARMRAAGMLAELRSRDLAFTAAEAYELLIVAGHVQLGKDDVAVLVQRTEGWPAALVLAGLWLQTVEDPASAVRAFGGDHRFVAAYLSHEVFASLDEDRRAFLYAVAVLGEFTAELCDAVLDRTDSAARLADLERSNLFVLGLERGGWFRIHSMFAEYARAQLASSDPTLAATIHRRAARWLHARDLPVEAVTHAAAAGDHELVAQLLAEYHRPLLRNGASATFLAWVRTLPDDCMLEHPELAAAAAVATVLLTGGVTTGLRRFLQLAQRSGRSDPYVGNWMLVARALALDGGVRQAVQDGRDAVELAQAGTDQALTGALAACARALFFAGDLDEARALATRVLEHPDLEQRPPSFVHAHATLALVAVERGRLASARSHAEKARAVAGRISATRSWLGANAAIAVGAVLAAEGHLAEAEHELATARRLLQEEAPDLHQAWLRLLLARVGVRRGRLDEAEAGLAAAREELAELGDSGRVAAIAGEAEREFQAARRRAASGEMLQPPSEAELGVLRLLARGLSAHEISERLFLSPNTIRSHRHTLYRKLGVHSREDAIARATVLGLLSTPGSPGLSAPAAGDPPGQRCQCRRCDQQDLPADRRGRA